MRMSLRFGRLSWLPLLVLLRRSRFLLFRAARIPCLVPDIDIHRQWAMDLIMFEERPVQRVLRSIGIKSHSLHRAT